MFQGLLVACIEIVANFELQRFHSACVYDNFVRPDVYIVSGRVTRIMNIYGCGQSSSSKICICGLPATFIE